MPNWITGLKSFQHLLLLIILAILNTVIYWAAGCREVGAKQVYLFPFNMIFGQ